MPLQILFAKKSKAKFEGLKVIPLDASLEESHLHQALVTSNPVEEGSDVTDHVSINPVTLTMTGFVTDSPVKFLQGVQQLLSSTSGSGSISSSAHDDLRFLFNSKTPFTVVTGLDTYENMVFRRLNFPRNAQTGETLRFEAELVQVTFASFQTAALNSDTLSEKLDSKNQADSKRDLGKQNTDIPTDSEVTRSSFLFDFLNDAGILR